MSKYNPNRFSSGYDYKFSSNTILKVSSQIKHYNNVLYNEYIHLNDVINNLANTWCSDIGQYAREGFNVLNQCNKDRFRVVDTQCRFLCEVVNTTYINTEVNMSEVMTDCVLPEFK